MRHTWFIEEFIMLILTAILVYDPKTVLADSGAPTIDKSTYTLFNPVPNDQMRDFSTDRPTKSDSPYTVDVGHFQYEADIVNWTYDRYNTSQTTSSNLLIGDPVLKAGLTQDTDLEIALAPININQTHNRSTGTDNTVFGFGDVYTRLKFNLFGNDGGSYALAIVPYIKAPTAGHGLGNNHVEGGGYVPLQMALPDDWTLTFMSELDILENASLNGVHANYQNLINAGHPVFTNTVIPTAHRILPMEPGARGD